MLRRCVRLAAQRKPVAEAPQQVAQAKAETQSGVPEAESNGVAPETEAALNSVGYTAKKLIPVKVTVKNK